MNFVFARKTARFISRAVLLAGVTIVAACSTDRVAGPDLALRAADSKTSDAWDKFLTKGEGNVLKVNGSVQWAKTLDTAIVRTFTVTDKDGGDLSIKELGFTIKVPKNALDNSDSKTPFTIKVTALPGKVMAYSFEPHGTKFLEPLEIKQDLKFTDWKGNKLKGLLRVGYFAQDWQLDQLGNRILIDEWLPALLDGNTLNWDIHHFSGYMVSMD